MKNERQKMFLESVIVPADVVGKEMGKVMVSVRRLRLVPSKQGVLLLQVPDS
jgi:hypothetical protein